MFGLSRRARPVRTGYELYTQAVQAARRPWFYGRLSVPDTLDGRFDMIALHVVLLLHRLRPAGESGPRLAQAVFDAMFADMDFNLREMGVSDMNVGKRNKQMWEALHGRAMAYEAALDDPAALAEALGRNVWRGAAPEGAAAALAGYVARARDALAAQPIERLEAGQVGFPA
jgi:cytochrome b pre-mRNA-processing protein 3